MLSITLVLTLEAVNTAIECVVDLVTSDYHELAKQAKDIAAFSVMVVSIFALIMGLMILYLTSFKGDNKMSYQSHYFQEVRKAQQRAYVPYSHFKVGAYLKQKTVAILWSKC